MKEAYREAIREIIDKIQDVDLLRKIYTILKEYERRRG